MLSNFIKFILIFGTLMQAIAFISLIRYSGCNRKSIINLNCEKMKRMTLLVLLLPLLGVKAQSLGSLQSNQNAYRPGDQVLKQQIHFIDPGASGKNLNWDFRSAQPIDYEYALDYFTPNPADTNRICGREHRTRYYYEQAHDSLWATGYENSTTYMRYIKPELKMKYPFNYGDTLYSEFEGKGEYGRRLKLRVEGYTRVHADAEGELMLPGNEVIKKALRVHTLRHYTETGKDSIEMMLDTYSWYAAGMRYPVFESIKTTVLKRGDRAGEYAKDTTVFTTSFYYPPIDQQAQIEEDFVWADTENSFTDESIFTEARINPNPVVNTLSIDYRLTRDASIAFSLHNNNGIALINVPAQNMKEGFNSTQINMSYFLSGVYTLYVRVDDMVMSLNVIKK